MQDLQRNGEDAMRIDSEHFEVYEQDGEIEIYYKGGRDAVGFPKEHLEELRGALGAIPS
jgi:hypothetical protein